MAPHGHLGWFDRGRLANIDTFSEALAGYLKAISDRDIDCGEAPGSRHEESRIK